MIFVGFSDLSSGWRLFDPIERKYVSGAEHVNFYEDMTQRQDSLRNFDRRRRILTKKEQRPLIINDNDASDVDRLSIESVRNLYIDPDEVSTTPVVPISSVDLEGFLNDKKLDGIDIDAMTQQTIKNIQQKFSPDKIKDEEELHNERVTELKQKLSQKAKKAAAKKRAKDESMIRRPLRLTAVGTKEPLSQEDKDFITTAKKHNYQIKYQY